MNVKQSRIYEITESIDAWLDRWNENSKEFNPNGFNFHNYFKMMKVNKTEAKRIKQFYVGEVADYDELERMPSKQELDVMSEYDKDQWLQLEEAYSHVKSEDIKSYQTAIHNLLDAVDRVIH